MSPIALEQENHARDAAFNKVMHGSSSQAGGGMQAMFKKDRAAQQAAVEEYFKHWDDKPAGDETDETRKVLSHSLVMQPLACKQCLSFDRLDVMNMQP